jgi:hypothetical protein
VLVCLSACLFLLFVCMHADGNITCKTHWTILWSTDWIFTHYFRTSLVSKGLSTCIWVNLSWQLKEDAKPCLNSVNFISKVQFCKQPWTRLCLMTYFLNILSRKYFILSCETCIKMLVSRLTVVLSIYINLMHL